MRPQTSVNAIKPGELPHIGCQDGGFSRRKHGAMTRAPKTKRAILQGVDESAGAIRTRRSSAYGRGSACLPLRGDGGRCRGCRALGRCRCLGLLPLPPACPIQRNRNPIRASTDRSPQLAAHPFPSGIRRTQFAARLPYSVGDVPRRLCESDTSHPTGSFGEMHMSHPFWPRKALCTSATAHLARTAPGTHWRGFGTRSL
jgi:hypothetical protein